MGFFNKLINVITKEQLNKIRELYEISFPENEKKLFDLIVKFNGKTFEIFSIKNNNEFIGLAKRAGKDKKSDVDENNLDYAVMSKVIIFSWEIKDTMII